MKLNRLIALLLLVPSLAWGQETIRGQRDDTATQTASEGQERKARITEYRGLHTNLRDEGGNEVGTASTPLITDLGSTTLNSTLKVNIFNDDWGLATEAKQDTIIGHVNGVEGSLTSIDGKITACNTGAVVVSSGSLTCNAGTNLNTSALALDATVTSGNAILQDIYDQFYPPIVGAYSSGGFNTFILPRTTGGLSVARFLDLDESDVQVKASNGQFYGYFFHNAAASTRYLKLYDATTGGTTVGSTAPKITIPFPAGASANVEWTMGIPFTNAITAACTTGLADADTGAPSANDCIANIFYK